jgi:hypothetical protein
LADICGSNASFAKGSSGNSRFIIFSCHYGLQMQGKH